MPAWPEIEAMDLLQNIRLVWTRYQAFRAALAELEGYSDHELGELGARVEPATAGGVGP
jgi:uncharacterized protein YjiS (DUF1127 family)